MSKQMKWGLATLMLLLGIAAVFLLTDNDTAKPTKYVLGQSTKDLLKKGVKLPQQANAPDDEQRPPPPDDGREYEWHGTHWDLVGPPHAPIVPSSTERTDKSAPLSPEERVQQEAKLAELRKVLEESKRAADQKTRKVYELGQERASLMSMIEKSIERKKRVQEIRDAEKAGEISLFEAMRLEKEIWESPEARAYAELAESMEENQSEKD